MATSPRAKRKDVTGAPGWQVSSAALSYRHRKEQQQVTITPLLLPAIDFPGGYRGPVLPPTEDSLQAARRLRLLDEIVCFEFYGKPPISLGWPYNFLAASVWHHDGDMQNCRAENLAWVIDGEYVESLQSGLTRSIMRPDFLPHRGWVQYKTKGLKRLNFTNSPDIRGHQPVGIETKVLNTSAA